MAIQADDFLSNSLSGSLNVTGGQIIYEDTIKPIDFEGDKTFTINFRKVSVNGPIVYTTDSISLSDTANITAVISNTSILNEGDLVTFTVTSSGVTGTNVALYYSTLGNVTYNDFVGGNVGSFYLLNGSGTITLQANADLTNTPEGEEQFRLDVRSGSTGGSVLKTSSNVLLIKDTSNVISIDSLSLSSNNISETEAITVNLSTLNAYGNAGSTLYYTIAGNADIYSGQSGTVIVNDNSATVELIAEGTVPDNEERTFAFQLRSGSTSGPILDTTEYVTVNNYLPSGNALGGTVSTSGNYRIHTFTSTANLNVTTAFPSTSKVEILLVGGGGAGSGPNSIGSGGGAGGALYGNLALSSGDNLVTIGSGGTAATPIGNPGSNTTYLGYIAVGGGGGVSFGTSLPGTDGQAGGSGGGGQGNRAGLKTGGISLQTPQGDLIGYGNRGGNSAVALGDPIGCGGGGGIGTAGIDATPSLSGGGGRGLYFTITGSNVGYGGGGIGHNYNYGNAGSPARAWGGGDYSNIPGSSLNGILNTGGGGAGSGFIYGPAAGTGGSGIAVFRYRINPQITSRISYITDVIANTNSIVANDLVAFNVYLLNAQEGETLYYDTVGDTSDFLSSNSGSFAVSSNAAVITLQPNYVENASNINLRIRRNSTTGTILKTSSNVLVIPNFELLTGISPSSNSINQLDSVIFSLESEYGTPGSTTYYYTVEGNATIYSSNSGTATVGTDLTVVTDRDATIPDNTDRHFNVKIRSGNVNGIVLQTSEDIFVNSAQASNYNLSIAATGGNITTSGNFVTHSYNTSSSLNITRAGEANILVVGGGGGGGSSNPAGWQSGGGGAGGLVYAPNYTLPIGTYTITIGAGGAGDNNGANTTFISPAIELRGLGGGRGGNGGFGGYPGGSGGGGAHNNPGFGLALQANASGDSGVYGYGYPGAGGGYSVGGGGGGASEAGFFGNRPGGNGLPVVMLTEGQADYYAGGGGGGGATGGLGGGGQGPGPAGAGVVNSGGGGGSSGYYPGNPGGPGGSGIVLVKYLGTPATLSNPLLPVVTETSANTNSISGGDLVTFDISSIAATEGLTFYYDTVGNVDIDTFVGGNTGSFTVSSNAATLSFLSNTVSVSKTFRTRIKRNQAGPVIRISDLVTINPPEIEGLSIPESLYVSEGSYLVLSTTGASGNAAITYDYETTGNGALFPSSGTIVVNDNVGNTAIAADGFVPEGETRETQLVIKNQGVTVLTSNIISITKAQPAIEATGGTILSTPSSKIHVYTSTGPFSVTSAPPSWEANLMIVAGGGVGGQDRWSSDRAAGGGGAGGMILTTITSANATTGQSYTMTVGAGGSSPQGPNGKGNNGSNSTGFGLTAIGGGGGGGHGNPPADTSPSNPGGSSGGIAYSPGATLGSGTPGQGFPGFNGAGGGGGAGEAGKPGIGGNGRSIVWFTDASYGESFPGTGQWFAGGGGGRSPSIPGPLSRGGLGGGGQGGGPNLADPPYNGQVNTGGGGGAIRGTSTPGLGGSGIIAIQYAGAFFNRVLSLVSDVTANTNTIYANDLVTFTVATVGASDGDTLYYSTKGNVSSFIGANTGSFVVNSNSGTVTLRPASVLVPEEKLGLVVRRSSATGTILYESNVITVEPSVEIFKSVSGPANTFTAVNTEINLDTYGLPNTQDFYYTIAGNALIASNTSGVISSTSNLIVVAEQTTDSDKSFKVQIRSANTSGIILGTTDDIFVIPLEFTSATGGDDVYEQSLSDGTYKTHVFSTASASPAQFVVSGSPSGTIEVVATGGGGGAGGADASAPGGGAGAGGTVQANVSAASTTYHVYVAGGGGAGAGSRTGSGGGSAGINGGGTGGNAGGSGSSGAAGGGGGWSGIKAADNSTFVLVAGGGASGGGGGEGSANETTALGGGNQPTANGTSMDGANGTPYSGDGGGYAAGGGGLYGGAGYSGGAHYTNPTYVVNNTRTNGASQSGTTGGAAPGIILSGTPGTTTYGKGGNANSGAGTQGVVMFRYRLVSANPVLSIVTSAVANVSPLEIDSSFGLIVNTFNAGNGETFYWDGSGAFGNPNAFREGNTGSFSVTSNTATIPLTANNEYLTSNTAGQINIRRSLGGDIIFTSTITANNLIQQYISATGGTESTSGGYKYHVFTSTAPFQVSKISKGVPQSSTRNTIDYLVVAGGGGGGKSSGGGGGAGGFMSSSMTLGPTNVGVDVIAVGGGGAGGPGGNVPYDSALGRKGSNSTIALFGLDADGGGGGGTGNPPGAISPTRSIGGSGGGSGYGPGFTAGAPGYPGQGNPGGAGAFAGGGGGGGGAGAAGTANPANEFGGPGGIGAPVAWVPASYGTPGPAPGRWFAGGGGGSSNPNTRQGLGGAGGGGNGGRAESPQPPGTAGTTNTGGGGGGSQAGFSTGMAGGSGIVIIRYPIG